MSFLYVMSNKSMPGIVKIGVSSRHPGERATDLQTTGVPTPFIVEYYAFFGSYVWEAEKEAQKKLHSYRISDNREFFNVSVDNAISAIQSLGIKFEQVYIRDSESAKQSINNQITEHIRDREKAEKCEKFLESCIKIKDLIKDKEKRVEDLSARIEAEGRNDDGLGSVYLTLIGSFVLGFAFFPIWLLTALCLYVIIADPISKKNRKRDLMNNFSKCSTKKNLSQPNTVLCPTKSKDAENIYMNTM